MTDDRPTDTEPEPPDPSWHDSGPGRIGHYRRAAWGGTQHPGTHRDDQQDNDIEENS